MAYATVGDVQARIPTQLWSAGFDSQPTQDQVCAWLQETSDWVDRTLAWKYTIPITDPTDLATLQPIITNLVAAQVWDVLAGTAPQYAETGARLERRGKQALAYNASTGRSMIAMNNTGFSDTGEAVTDFPDSSFTDPSEVGGRRRRRGCWDDWGVDWS
jgi:hypothetical protein